MTEGKDWEKIEERDRVHNITPLLRHAVLSVI